MYDPLTKKTSNNLHDEGVLMHGVDFLPAELPCGSAPKSAPGLGSPYAISCAERGRRGGGGDAGAGIGPLGRSKL